LLACRLEAGAPFLFIACRLEAGAPFLFIGGVQLVMLTPSSM